MIHLFPYGLYFLVAPQLSYRYKRHLLIGLLLTPILLTLYFSWSANIWQVTLDDYHAQLLRNSWVYHVLFKNLFTRCAPMIIGIITANLYLYHQQKLTTWCQNLPLSYYNLLTFGLVLLLILTVRSDASWYLIQDKHCFFTSTTWLILMRYVFSISLAGLILLCTTPRGLMKIIYAILSSALWRPFGQLTFSMYMISLVLITTSYGWFFVTYLDPTVEMIYRVMLRGFILSLLSALVLYCYVEMPKKAELEAPDGWQVHRDKTAAQVRYMLLKSS